MLFLILLSTSLGVWATIDMLSSDKNSDTSDEETASEQLIADERMNEKVIAVSRRKNHTWLKANIYAARSTRGRGGEQLLNGGVLVVLLRHLEPALRKALCTRLISTH